MDVTAIIITIINSLLVPLVMWAVKEGAEYLKAKSKNEKLDGYITLIDRTVSSVVADVAQTFTDEIRKSGLWNKETAAEAAQLAFEKSKAMIGEKAYNGFSLLVGDAEQYIKSRIEEEVRINKTAITSDTEGGV